MRQINLKAGNLIPSKTRLPILAILIIVIPLGFYTKFYQGPGGLWVQHYGGDIFYPIFWIYLALLFKPDLRVIRLAAAVLIASSLIEFSQCLTHPILEIIRSSFIGRTMIGTDFELIDMVYYLIGTVVAVLLHKLLFQGVARPNIDLA